MAGMGTGYPNWFLCPKVRRIYYKDRNYAGHMITPTGRKKTAPGVGKGHPRKSKWSWEYNCTCGHHGWSCHIELERTARVSD